MTLRGPDPIAEQLRARGLRATAPRLAVYRAVSELADHPDVHAVAPACVSKPTTEEEP